MVGPVASINVEQHTASVSLTFLDLFIQKKYIL